MKDITPDALEEVFGGGECHQHYHREIVSHDNLAALQAVVRVVEVSADYAVLPNDDIIVVNTTGGNVVVTLPLAKGQREYTVVKKVAANIAAVNFSGGENCFGQTTISMLALGEVKRFKAFNNGWILV